MENNVVSVMLCYKGKGIRYVGEHIIRKVGKAGAKGKK